MDCKFAEKISLLIDNELPAEDAQQVKAHLSNCAECREVEKDFLFFRRQIKESVSESVRAAESAQMPFADSRKIPFWKKRVLLPTPVFALLLLLLAAFGIWTIVLNVTGEKTKTVAEDSK